MSVVINQSTTFININSLTSPFTALGLGPISYNGQTFTVTDNTFSYSLLSNPIFISSIATNNIETSYSTIIDQPGGFITFQTQNSNYQILNKYPFQNQFISAGLYNLTASTLFTQFISSVYDINVSSLVESLIVKNNYIQNQGITLLNNISSGQTIFGSSLSVYSSVTISSGLTVFGSTMINSSLQVYGRANFLSSIATQNIFVSSMLIGNILSSGNIEIRNELKGVNIEVQNSTLTTGIAANINNINTINVLSSINLGQNLNTGVLQILNNISSLSSVAIGKNVFINNLLSTSGLISTNNLATLSNISVLTNFINTSNLFTNTLIVNSTLTVDSILNTSTLIANNIKTIGSFIGLDIHTQYFSTLSSLTTTNIISYQSTIIQGTLSTFESLNVSNLLNTGNLQTISSITVEKNISTIFGILGNISIGQDLITKTLLSYSSLNIIGDINQNIQSTIIGSNMSIVGNLRASTVTVSSFYLPDALILNGLSTNSLTVGSILNTSSLFISTLFTSSIGIGKYPTENFEVDKYLQTNIFSSFYTSTQKLILNGLLTSTLNITSSLIVNTIGSNLSSILDVNTLAYLGGTTHVSSIISTATVGAILMSGIHSGDGSLLINVPLPQNIVFSSLFVSTLSSFSMDISTLYASASTSLTYSIFKSLSTTTINNFIIYGNAANLTSGSSINNIIATQTGLLINSTIYITKSGVAINRSTINSNYDLEINTTLKLKGLLDNYLPLQSLNTNILTTSTITVVGSAQTFISSIFLPNLSIIPEYINQTPLTQISVNTIQTSLSTLIFNSTLFIVKNNQVGINTIPNFNLDVNNTIRTTSLNISSIITNNIIITKSTNTLFVGTGLFSSGAYSNIRYSYDGITWQQSPTDFTTLFGTIGINQVAYNGSSWVALSYSNTSGSILSKSFLTSLDGISWSGTSSLNDTSDLFVASNLAYNGSLWVAVGSNSVSQTIFKPILYSSNGSLWNTVSVGYFSGRCIAFGSNIWVAGGSIPTGTIAVTTNRSILYSLNGISWLPVSLSISPNATLYPLNSVNDIIWDNTRWILVGDDGGGSNTIMTSLTGSNSWSAVTSSNPTGLLVANSISYNNLIYVMTGSNTSGNTIYYSYNLSNWSLAQGSLFAQNGRRVEWNGSYWLACGNDGIRQSYNGINWIQNSVSYQFTSIGLNSNQTPLIKLSLSTMNLNIYENPINGTDSQIFGNKISIYPSSLIMNNMFIGCSTNNLIIPQQFPIIEQQYANTMYVNGFANVSSFISVNSIIGTLYLGIQNV